MKTWVSNARLVRPNTASETHRHPHLSVKKMASPDVVGELEDLIADWRYHTPVFIHSDMGTGKSTLVCKKLVTRVMEEGRGRKVLIVSGRLALNTQYKYLLLKQVSSPALKIFSPTGIQQKEEFEGLPVIFCTYQGLPGLMQRYRRGELGEIQYAVFDEIQWLCSDALFAEDTGKLLYELPRAFQKCVRIYMTATPWAVRNLVAQAEVNAPRPVPDMAFYHNNGYFPYSNQLLYYEFPAPKRKYRLHVLPAEVRQDLCHKTLIDLILDQKSGKWIVFVDSKKQGKALAQRLGDDADYLDADCKSGPLWETLTRSSRFPHRVLITTAVAEVGLNILDPEVQSVVILSTDHAQFMQELGRRRFSGDEVVDVYVPDLSAKDLAWRRGRNTQLLQELRAFKALPKEKRNQMRLHVWYSDLPELRRLLPIDGNGNLQVNPCAEQVILQRDLQYQELERLRLDEGIESPFIYMVQQWLGAYEIETVYHDDVEKRKRDLLAFLEEMVGADLESKEAQEAFSNQFRTLRKAAFGPREVGNRRTDPWGAQILQGELEALELPYVLEQAKGKWVIRRIEEPKQESEEENNVAE